ncbi:enolase C-terminal domain-like protein [Nocardioides sp. AN3]
MVTTERPDGPEVASVQAAAYTIPTDLPEADGTLAWDSTTLVIVTATTGDPALPVGTGWTYAPAATAHVVTELLAGVVCGRDALDVVGAWEAMVRAVRNAGRQGVVGMAISAVDVALWDLAARLLDQPLHRLLGRCRDDVPLYGSGGFTTYSEKELRAQLACWLDQGFERVKIKIGESWGAAERRDVARVEQTRAEVGDDAEVFVDANGGYAVKQAVRVGRALDALDVRWFEEPVSSDHPAQLRIVRDTLQTDVAAGEYGWDLAGLARLVDSVDCLQIDATRCGGFTEWRRAAALAAAHGLQVSAHCAPALHGPVALATPNLCHVEWFHDHARIERMLLDPPPDPTGGRLLPSNEPGHGFTLRETDLERYRVA